MASEKSANNAVEFEGSLERDLYHLLDFDWAVERFEEQPVEILYKDARGRTRKYTPDVLIEYVPEVERKPVLAEVKFRNELKEHWRVFKPRFRAALRFARENGWVFRLLTEREIRTQSLLNTKFLRRFKNRNVEEEDMQRILRRLARSGETTLADLLAQLSDDKWEQARLLPTVWHLVANRRIDVNLQQSLNMRCELRSNN